EPPTEPFTDPPMTDAHPPIPETEPVLPEGAMTFMEPSPRRSGRDPTFSVEVEPEDAPGGITPRGEVRTMRREQAPPFEPEPGAFDLFDELRRLFEGVKLPPMVAPAEGATLLDELLVEGATGLDADDREAIGQRRLDKLRAELQD